MRIIMMAVMEGCFLVLLVLTVLLCILMAFSHSDSDSYSGKPQCHEGESSALFQFKDSFLVINKKWIPSCYPISHSKVNSWIGDARQCCSWDGVDCDMLTGHVIGLDVNDSCLYGHLYPNSSLFRLVHLRKLNLAYNHFRNLPIPSEIGSFSHLTHLNLSHSAFAGQIPLQISNLSKLVSLDLSSYVYDYEDWQLKLNDSGLVEIIQSLPNLKQLHLSAVNISSGFPGQLSKLSSLESLQLQFCGLQGELPSFLGNLTNLVSLDLSFSDFVAPTTSLSWVSRLSNLSQLSLLNVNLSGEFPSSLMNLTQLRLLDLGYNQLTGPIPSWLANLPNLVTLYLDHNYLNDSIPSSLFRHKHLKCLHLGANQLSGHVPSEIGNHSALIRLELFSNQLQGTIPSTLFKLRNLRTLSLHSNNLSGSTDLASFFQLKNLRVLMLSFNNLSLLTGSKTDASRFPEFTHLGFSSCKLNGFPGFLRWQTKLRFLDLSSNDLHGQIPSWIWEISRNSIRYMNLSFNSLSGFEEGPNALQWAHISILDLRSNELEGSLSDFHGGVPPRSRNKCRLKMINLSYNRLQGQVSISLGYCRHLELIDFGHNQLSDTFPSWFGILPNLRILILRYNGFYGALGKIQARAFSRLQIVDLSQNNFTGELPAMYLENWVGMKNADTSQFIYFGETVVEERYSFLITSDGQYYSISLTNKGLQLDYPQIPSTLAAIDLSSNGFQGIIPDVIGNLTGLHILNLSHNKFNGEIPSSMGNINQLESMDLSYNQLSGEIPTQLTEIPWLSFFNVSYNSLSGRIPTGGEFDTFQSDSYGGNPMLCGHPLNKSCSDHLVPSAAPENNGSPPEFDWFWVIVVIGYASGMIIGIVAGCQLTERGKLGGLMQNFRRKQRQKPRKRSCKSFKIKCHSS